MKKIIIMVTMLVMAFNIMGCQMKDSSVYTEEERGGWYFRIDTDEREYYGFFNENYYNFTNGREVLKYAMFRYGMDDSDVDGFHVQYHKGDISFKEAGII